MSANRSFVCLPLLIGQSDLKGEGGGENPRLTVNIWQHIPIPLLLKILKPKEKNQRRRRKEGIYIFFNFSFLNFQSRNFSTNSIEIYIFCKTFNLLSLFSLWQQLLQTETNIFVFKLNLTLQTLFRKEFPHFASNQFSACMGTAYLHVTLIQVSKLFLAICYACI
jgi:ABC-type antimicrobial peptide transport system permease subunit